MFIITGIDLAQLVVKAIILLEDTCLQVVFLVIGFTKNIKCNW